MLEETKFDFNEDLNDGRLIYTISQISDEIKNVLEDTYPKVWLCGEVSNFKTYNSGHMYFNLKDEKAQIRAVMFQGFNSKLNFKVEDGMKVLVFGKITSYITRGDYQVVVYHMEQTGKGALYEAYETLKKKLAKEGLFDDKFKKTIPDIVNKIGVITSKDGAALHDILRVLESLQANVEVLIYPVRVQGEQAPKEIIQAIKYLNKNHKELDVLLVGRGGGSIEDLRAFNDEDVSREIFASQIPIVSCVGHEVDFTIADFVADLRAATPSAAAELIVRKRNEIKQKLQYCQETLKHRINSIYQNCKDKLDSFVSCRALSKPHLIYEDKIAYIDELNENLNNAFHRLIKNNTDKLENISQKLNLVSPLNILKRGFSICKDESNKIIKHSLQVKPGDNIKIKLCEGTLLAKVEHND